MTKQEQYEQYEQEVAARNAKEDAERMSRHIAEQRGYMMATPIAQTITRLLDEAPLLEGKGEQTRAITCHVKLRGETGTILGALSWTPEGTIRMLSGATVDGKESLLESFFDVRDIVSVMVVRPVSVAPSIILQ